MDYLVRYLFFFFNDTATTEIYTLSLPDALPISKVKPQLNQPGPKLALDILVLLNADDRSEEHTSELQSLIDIVCRLLLEKTCRPSQGQRRGIHDYGDRGRTTGGNTARLSHVDPRWRRCAPVQLRAVTSCKIFFLRIGRPPRSTLFPYTTLFG